MKEMVFFVLFFVVFCGLFSHLLSQSLGNFKSFHNWFSLDQQPALGLCFDVVGFSFFYDISLSDFSLL